MQMMPLRIAIKCDVSFRENVSDSEMIVSADLEKLESNHERLKENDKNSSTEEFDEEIDNLVKMIRVAGAFENNVNRRRCINLRGISGIMSVAIAPLLCSIASLVSVEKETEEMVDGSTSDEIKAMLLYREESVEELVEETVMRIRIGDE